MTGIDDIPRQSTSGKPSVFVRFMRNVLPTVLVLGLMCVGLAWFMDRQDRKFAEEQRQKIAAGVALTSRGCPAVRDKIREIGADGTYSRREIEILSAMVTAEQAKPNGLTSCRAPSWHWFWGGWVVSTRYAE